MKFWPTKTLGDLCSVVAGGTPSRSRSDFYNGGIPWVKISDMLQGKVMKTEETISQLGLENSSAKVLPTGTVLISIFATIGRTAVLGIKAATNQAIAGVTPTNPNEIISPFLRYYLDYSASNLVAKARGVAQLNINGKILKSLLIPVPPLSEQARLVKLLDEADELRKLRAQADHRTDALIPALFHEMFGDPVTNPRRWPKTCLGDLCELINGAPFKPSDWDGYGLPIVRIQNLNDSTKPFNYTSKKMPEKFRVMPGDTLLSWSGTPGTSFGCFKWGGPEGWLNQHIFNVKMRVQFDREFFIHSVNARLSELIAKAHGGVGLQHVTKGTLNAVEMLVPPLPAQKEFAQRVNEIRGLETIQSASRQRLDDLFQSILHRAFRGEL